MNFIQLQGKPFKPNQTRTTPNATTNKTVFPSKLENKTKPTENNSVSKEIERILNNYKGSVQKENQYVSSMKQTDEQPKNGDKEVYIAMGVADIIKQGEQLVDRSKHQAFREMKEITRDDTIDRESGDDDSDEAAPMEDSGEKDKYERGKGGLLFPVETAMSIQRFRSFISSMTGSDGREHPAIERILSRDAGKEDDIMETAREYYQENIK